MEELRRCFARIARKSDLFYLENNITPEDLTLNAKSAYLSRFMYHSEDIRDFFKECPKVGFTFKKVGLAVGAIVKKGLHLNLTPQEINSLEYLKKEFVKSEV